MNRTVRLALSCLAAVSVVMAPTAARASDENVVVASNQTDGAAVVEAGVQFRVSPSGLVDEENRAYAVAECAGCQTVAAAFQIVLIPADDYDLAPQNEAFARNVLCEECVTWASAKQIVVATRAPAYLSGSGYQRLAALEARIEALEADLPGMSLGGLQSALDAAAEELLAVAREEILLAGDRPAAAEVVAVRSS